MLTFHLEELPLERPQQLATHRVFSVFVPASSKGNSASNQMMTWSAQDPLLHVMFVGCRISLSIILYPKNHGTSVSCQMLVCILHFINSKNLQNNMFDTGTRAKLKLGMRERVRIVPLLRLTRTSQHDRLASECSHNLRYAQITRDPFPSG